MVSSAPSISLILSVILIPLVSLAFQIPSPKNAFSTSATKNHRLFTSTSSLHVGDTIDNDNEAMLSRRSAIVAGISTIATVSTAATSAFAAEGDGSNFQSYEDFASTSEGWSYKDVKIGKDIGGELKDGDRVVFDWSGYTIGYFGRPFEAKGGPQGGAFDKDLNYFRTTLGSKTLVPGLECALRNMKPGGIRQVIIPYGPLSYPPEDKEHELVGPKPTTFSGMRALNFVLDNPRVDRTLLFNVKLIRVDRGDGKGGFIRG